MIWVYKKGVVAQMAEHLSDTQRVGGSNPPDTTKWEQRSVKIQEGREVTVKIMKNYEVVIAVDPKIDTKKKVAISVWVKGQIQCVIRVRQKDLQAQFREFANEYCNQSVIVAVEDQYLGKNYQASKKLTEQKNRIFGWCDLLGFDTVSVPAATWQGPILGVFNETSEERKLLSQMIAKGILGMRNDEELDEDSADAVCLGQYIVNRTKQYFIEFV